MEPDHPTTKVIIAPGHSMRRPGKVTTAKVAVAGGGFEERVIDAESIPAMPGEEIDVYTKDLHHLIHRGVVLDPAGDPKARPHGLSPVSKS